MWRCPDDWTYFPDYSCYHVFQSTMTYAACESYCSGYGAATLCIKGSKQEKYLSSVIKSETSWIGYTDLSQEGNFQWRPGCSSTYINWASGEPWNTEKDCTVYSDDVWNNVACGREYWCICEYDDFAKPSVLPTSAPSAEPTATPLPIPQPTALPTIVPTMPPYPAPTATFDSIENKGYLAMGICGAFLYIFKVLLLNGKCGWKKNDKLKKSDLAIVWCSGMDFVTDILWIESRRQDYYRDGSQFSWDLYVAGLVLMVFSCTIFCGMAMFTLGSYRNKIDDEVRSHPFHFLIFVLSSTNPEAMVLFPWLPEAYENEVRFGSRVNERVYQFTFLRLFIEDVPQFILQLVYISAKGLDAISALNLTFTCGMLAYTAFSKIQKLLCMSDAGRLGRTMSRMRRTRSQRQQGANVAAARV